ncbi:hypothetical protein OAM17_01655 [Nitrosopumilus sp.]|nr:hypothetical protein [Nitrosopumilus sp.]
MSNYPTILSTSNEIIKKYNLCDYCLGRLFTKQLRLSSNKILGKKLKNGRESNHSCYICKNLFDNLDHFLKLMLDSSFETKNGNITLNWENSEFKWILPKELKNYQTVPSLEKILLNLL